MGMGVQHRDNKKYCNIFGDLWVFHNYVDAESLFCAPETNVILHINSASIKHTHTHKI